MPPAPVILLPSKGEINRCGNHLKDIATGSLDPKSEEEWERFEHALKVVGDFRAAHAYPMQKIRYGLRSMVRTERADVVVSQRLKRVPRIVRKLHRMGNSNLARIEDIGGCRAVLRDGPELERVKARIVRQWKGSFARDPRDYIAAPKELGYRAVHFVVRRDDRAIEVQLRTRGQQQWAEAVEAADARLGRMIPDLMLKDGIGPDDLVQYFKLAGEVIYRREYGMSLTSQILEDFEASRRAVIQAGYYKA